ncbi:MAG: cell division topological specificity factor MinE [Legionellales bacterium]|nr:cell division topological specificity factor MinE [Legionellales bacterium]
MSWLKSFTKCKKPQSASFARERLQIIVQHNNHIGSNEVSPYIMDMREELINVMRKYIQVDEEQVVVNLETKGNHSVLELNVTLQDEPA